jgi:hypothetical protein
MFAEASDEQALREWVASVQALRYKDFRCIAKPSPSVGALAIATMRDGEFMETTSMKTFAEKLETRGLGLWFRKLMFT